MRTDTICSKHDEIISLSNQIIKSDEIEEIHNYARDLREHAENCLKDGQNMEYGLDKKRNRIEELEKENEEFEKEIRDLKSMISDLEDKHKEYENEIDDLNTKISKMEETE